MMRRVLASLTIAIGLLAGPVFACPGLDAACEIEGGVYHARLPEGPARGVALYLHGWGGVGRDSIAREALARPFLERGYALIAPQGLPRRQGDRGGRWNANAAGTWRDDVAFLRAVLADAQARLGLDGLPVLASGFSGGGMMIWRLACDAPETADAYAPIAGLMWRPLPARCQGPVRLAHSHGWTDDVVPMEGRAVGGGVLTQGDLFDGLALLRRAAGCAGDQPSARGVEGALWTRRWVCGEAEIALWLHPGGHARPPGWAEKVLDWFEAGFP
jgi:polyhydroxybutyrate depolymerase